MTDTLYPLIDQFGNHYQIRLYDNGDGSFSVSSNDGPYGYTPLGPGQFGLGCAVATALNLPAGARMANISVEGNSVRYTYDGVTTPTTTVGHLLQNGQSVQFSGAAVLAALKFIQVAATATLNVSYTK